MNRAIVVLLLLIANAIVSSSKVQPPPARVDYSLGRFAILDGAALPEQVDLDAVATPLCRRDPHSARSAMRLDPTEALRFE